MSKQSTTLDLLDLPEELVAAMSLLPGFEAQTEDWQEVDLDHFPSVGAAQYGHVEDVQISVSQIRTGGTQLSFVLGHPIDPDDYLAAVVWFYLPFGEVDHATGSVAMPIQFRIEGDYRAILDHDTLLRLIRQTDELLDNMLLSDARDILSSLIREPEKAAVRLTTCLSAEEQRRFFFDFYTRLANAA